MKKITLLLFFIGFFFIGISPKLVCSVYYNQSNSTKKDTVITAHSKIKKTDVNDLSNYSRSSLTILFLNFDKNDPYAVDLKKVFDSLKVPDKYNDNQIDVKYIYPDFEMRRGNCSENSYSDNNIQRAYDGEKMTKISNLLQKEKVACKIMAKWFNKSPEGKFNMNLVYERGLYNATDAEYNDARLTYRGITTELKDAGKKLVDKSYILVIDFGTILTFEQFDKMKTYVKGNKFTKKGYRSDMKTYLFKMDGDVAQKVYDIWDNGGKFDQLDFSLVPIAQIFNPRIQCVENLVGSQTRDFFIKQLVDDAIERAEYDLAEKYEDFRVKAPVLKVRRGLFPVIFAKIGKKEGLRLDSRYFAFEVSEDKNGKKICKRKGVFRVSNKIVDNRNITTGNTGVTKFYQVQGRRVDPGMTLQQKNDVGVGFSFCKGYALADFENSKSKIKYKSPSPFTMRLDILLSGTAFKKWFTDFRVYFELIHLGETSVADGQTFPTGVIPDPLSSTFEWAMGFSKDIHIMKNIKLSPFIQYNLARQLTIGDHGDDNKYHFKLFQLGYGCRLPISLTSWMELVPGITMYKARSQDQVAETQDKILVSPMYIDAAIRFFF